jgi:hypothetical protein
MTSIAPVQRHQLRRLLDTTDLAASLPPPGSWQPVPPFADRQTWKGTRPDLAEFVTGAATAAADTPWPQILAHHTSRYLRDGDRGEFETLYFGRRSRVEKHALAALITGDDVQFDNLVDGLWLICEESQWSIPAHDYFALDAQEGLPDPARPFLDLFAADTGALFAWTTIALGAELAVREPALHRRMADEVRRRVIRPYLEQDWGWYGPRGGRAPNNWNPWIHSNVLPAAFVFAASHEDIVATVEKAITGLDLFLDGYPDDGGCDEGVSYWWRAGASMIECLLTLRDASAGRIDLLDLPVLHAMARYPLVASISRDWNVNFADGSARSDPGENAHLLFRLGQVFGDADIVAHARAMRTVPTEVSTPGVPLERLLFAATDHQWADNSVTGAFYAGASDVLPDTEVLTARERPGRHDGLYLAAKGGHNAESHNHNDVGSFIVAHDGRPLLIDVGVESYTRKTFGPERYSIWTMRTSFHNLPTINGVEQQAGRDFAAADFTTDTAGAHAQLSLDLVKAYPDEAGIVSWRRLIRLDREPARVIVTDTWSLRPDANAVDLTLMTGDEPDITAAGLITWTARGAVVAYDGDRFAAVVERIDVDDAKLTQVWGHSVWRIRLRATGLASNGSHTLMVTST